MVGAAATVVALVGAASLFLWTLPAPWSTVVSNLLWNLSGTGLVVATGVAILRYRLYEIDVIIRKTLVYATLIATLAVIYLAAIYLIDSTLQTLTGQSNTLAVTLSTLTAAAAFQPLQRRIQRLVDRRFYRQKYDSTHILEVFADRLRDQIDLDSLHTDIITLVATTLQPRHTSLWLRPHPPTHLPPPHP